MIWRLTRLSQRTAKSPLQRARLRGQLRRSSGINISNSNIATILFTPPGREGESITAVGSVRTVRKQSNITFVELDDGSTADSLKALIFKKELAEGYVAVVLQVLRTRG